MGTLLINSVKVKTYKNLFYKMKTSAIFCASAFLGVSVNAVSEDICIRVVTGSDAHSEATGLDFIKATFLNDANEEIDVVDFELGPFRTGGEDIICNTANLAGNSKDSVSYKMQIHRSSTDGHKITAFQSYFGDEFTEWTYLDSAEFWTDGNSDASNTGDAACVNNQVCDLVPFHKDFCVKMVTGTDTDADSSTTEYVLATFETVKNGQSIFLENIEYHLAGPFDKGATNELCHKTSKLSGLSDHDIHVELRIQHSDGKTNTDGHQIAALKTKLGEQAEQSWALGALTSFWTDGNNDAPNGCLGGQVCVLTAV